MMRFAFAATVLGLAACTEAPAPEAAPEAPVVEPAAETPPPALAATEPGAADPVLPEIGPKADKISTREIDWNSARADLAGSNADSDEANVTIQSAGGAAEVPVLLPTGIVTAQSAGESVVYRQTADGYFAFYPGAAYNIIVNGTNQVIETANLENTNPDREPRFSSTAAGAHVWLTRYGADYTVEFECNDLDDETDSCIEEAEAMDIAEKLTIVGSK